MAFEALLTRPEARPRRRRRLTYSISIAAHGALLVAGVVYSFWHVEELSPPTVHVTFLAAAPPPLASPPPPPAGGGGEARKKMVPSKIKPTLTQLVQPRSITPKREEPKVDPKNDDDDDDPDRAIPGGASGGGKAGGVIGGTVGGTVGGVIGGKLGGTVGGVVGGAAGGPARGGPRLLPPQMADSQKLSGAEPDFPPVLRRSGLVYVVAAKICVSKAGAVDSVAIVQSADSLLDRNVVGAVKGWRYRPFMSNNTAVPFCTLLRFEFKSE
jgi:protein TonB